MSVKVAFYKGRDAFLDRLIQWWTGSSYSHCEIVVNGVSYSSSPRDGGVRMKLIDFNPQHWDFVEVPEAHQAAVLQWFSEHYGAKYDWVGLLGFVFTHRLNSADRWFCSEACAAALGIPQPWTLTPRDLFYLLADKGEPFDGQLVFA